MKSSPATVFKETRLKHFIFGRDAVTNAISIAINLEGYV